jgi:hypothetical protein
MSKYNEIILPESLDACPEYWQNFINYINPNGNFNQNKINYFLKENYNVTRYRLDIFDSCRRKIRFATTDDLTFFILVWS